MPNKTIIPIEVDDTQFKAFAELFQQFKGKLGELPADWDRVNASAATSHEALAGAMGVMVESMVAAKDHARDLGLYLKEAVEAQKQFGIITLQGETGLKNMTKHARSLAGELFGIGNFLLKMDVVGASFGGIAAFAGMFGIDKLATHAVRNQQMARGLGLSTGQLRAFQTDFGSRYMDEGVLESVANTRNDLGNRFWLQHALGISSQEIDQANTGDLAAQLAIKAHDWWTSRPDSQHNNAFYQSTGFSQSGISLEMARQLGNTDRAELVRAREQYNKDAGALNISDRDTDSLYAFARQVDLAGRNLETYFTSKLAQLGPSLGEFITTIEKDAEMLLDGILTPSNMEAIKSGIDDFAKYLGSSDFRDGAAKFMEDLNNLGTAIANLAKLINAPFGNYSTADLYAHPEKYHTEEPIPGVPVPVLNKPEPTTASGKNAKPSGSFSAAKKGVAPGRVPMDEATTYFKELETKYKLPDGILSAMASAESSFDPKAISKKGAQGLMQLIPSTSKALGVSDPFDWRQSAEGGAKLFRELQDRYKGDIRKEIAAWNWKPNDLDQSIDKHGSAWESHLPDETRGHIRRVLDVMARNQNKTAKVDLTITNKSGTNVATSINAGGVQ